MTRLIDELPPHIADAIRKEIKAEIEAEQRREDLKEQLETIKKLVDERNGTGNVAHPGIRL